jgi:arylformamidase
MEHMEEVYKGLTRDEIEEQYMLRNTRPSYETTDIPRWKKLSANFRTKTTGNRDIVYGSRPRNKLDLFYPNNTPEGLVLYIHGGYWQRGDKSVYSFIAEPFINRGHAVAVINYQMCPDVKLTEIAPQIRTAILYLWNNADRLGIPKSNFNLLGHSAGAHLTAEMLFTNWQVEDKKVPKNLIHAVVAISGIYDFEPILYCSENEGIRMDEVEAKAASVIHRQSTSNIPNIIAFGLNEPSEMQRQSIDFAKVLYASSDNTELIKINNADHFETVETITDESSRLFIQTCKLFNLI